MKTILVTGGAGFIGSNFVIYFLGKYPDLTVINLDKLTYAGTLDNLREIEGDPRHFFVEGDITDQKLVGELFIRYRIDGVIHLAAESHVDNSIARPSEFITTNINGTFTLLNTARHAWMEQGMLAKARFHHVSTDEVFGTLDDTGYFTESSPYAPNSPYSASKASSDFLVRSFHHTYGMNAVISNCSNNFGPKQHDEKLIPTVIRSALKEDPIPIYGEGKNIRDWLFVTDHCRALDLIYHHGRAGETYNIGTRNEVRNLDLARKLCGILDAIAPKRTGSYSDQITFVTDRPGHDFRYAIDPSKIEQEVGFSAIESFDEALRETVRWYCARYS
jgi:dTDP-glucose 4,6-dehydratase